MKNYFLFFIIIASSAGFYTCQETDEVFLDEPRVRIVFYNLDSLSEVNIEVKKLDTAILNIKETLSVIDSTATVLSDSLLVLSDSIDNGGINLIPIYDEMKLIYDQILITYEENKVAQTNLNDGIKEWAKVASKINSGLMFLSSITNLNNDNNPAIYEDSASVWPLPLDLNHDTVKLALEIAGVKYLFGLAYDRNTIIDDLSRLTVEASSLKLIEFDDTEYGKTGTIRFDSVKLKCKTQECIDNEASIAIYY